MGKKPTTIEEAIQSFLANAKVIKASVEEIGKIDSLGKVFEAGKEITKLIKAIVALIERVQREFGGISGKERKKLVVQTIDNLIKLPFFLEAIDGLVIGFMVDNAVDWINDKYGHEWSDSLIDRLCHFQA